MPLPADDDDWNRLCFIAGQEGLFADHLAVRDAWTKNGIVAVQVRPALASLPR